MRTGSHAHTQAQHACTQTLPVARDSSGDSILPASAYPGASTTLSQQQAVTGGGGGGGQIPSSVICTPACCPPGPVTHALLASGAPSQQNQSNCTT